MMIAEHDSVILNKDVEEHGLQKGDIGVVVGVYADGAGFEVEFMTMGGRTIALCALSAADVRPVGDEVIHHARSIAV